ncbi:Lrp/AsnC family transcriptional regulator [Halomontanus rarus]|uniref:Lrp/AsnC family transcriptional regulator n=1 Tax=Halomontanus rarus TaxID=3034020 RepID=UPI001A99945E|nr:Lrp/AsnC family transcriptional regulator [Halovivax sp. TS33]
MADASVTPSESEDVVGGESIQELITDHLDEIDYQIYRILNEDGRISDTELGDRVGLSRTAVRRRRKKLQQDNVIKIIAVMVLQEVDLEYADVRIALESETTTREVDEFVDYLLEQELVYEVNEYLGETDLLVRVWHSSLREIKSYVNELVHHSDVVSEYEVVPVIQTHKAWHSEIDAGPE